MKNNIYGVGRKIGYILCIFLLSIICYSQFTPARGTFVVTPPYPNKLSDYGNPNLLKMSATITATDPSFTSKAIRLKLSIFYNQQLLMQGNDMVVGERPMYLTMGQMLILTQADLAPYFQQQNMRVSPVQYSQTLREGFYQFQLDILDYYSLQKIGLPLVASIYIMRYDPPQLYKPDNKAILMDKGQGLIQFQWNPRQIAPNTEYEFTLVELQQEKFVDPAIEFTARRAGSYYYKTTTRMNTLNYGMMGELPLRWGKSYAWQVRAVTREGMDQVGTYEQDGYTDIRWFTYQKYCPVPTNIAVDVKSSEEATYTWDAAPEHTSFILKITAADNPENTWLSVYPQEAKFEETQYRPDITYFYKLQGVCGEGKSEESGERSFTMLPKGQIKNFKCNEGDGTESTGFETIANQKLLERDLQVGDTFTYSNWCKISVKSVEKVGGYYKGKGVYRMPLAMFGFPLINIIFDSITVNTDLVALSGGFEAVNRGMKGVADVDEAVNTATNIVSNVQELVDDVKQLVEDVNQFLNNYTGTQEDKANAVKLQEQTNTIANTLLNNPNLPKEQKQALQQSNEKAQEAWKALQNGEKCSQGNTMPEGKGPYINMMIVANTDYDCYIDAIKNENKELEQSADYIAKIAMNDINSDKYKILLDYVSTNFDTLLQYKEQKTTDIGYKDSIENGWINQWKISTDNKVSLSMGMVKITRYKDKIPAIDLNMLSIYIDTLKVEDTLYKIAVYGGIPKMLDIKKILDKTKFLYKYTLNNYHTFAFYDEISKEEPAMIIQILKNNNDDKRDWEEYLEFKEVLDTTTLQGVQFVSQYDPMFPKAGCCTKQDVCCKCACDEILSRSNTSTNRTMQVQVSVNKNTDCEITSANGSITTITHIIDTSLFSHKLPIVVGVHHPQKKVKDRIVTWYHECSGNTPNVTNHYIVIVGKGYDDIKKMYYYRFYDVRTSDSVNGTSINNKLYINTTSNMIEGNTEGVDYQGTGYYYKLTEVRKNIGQTY